MMMTHSVSSASVPAPADADEPRPEVSTPIGAVGLVNPDGSVPSSRLILAPLEREFPHVDFVVRQEPPAGAVIIRERDWQEDAGYPYRWDGELSRLLSLPGWLVITAAGRIETSTRTVAEILTRYQRLIPRRNHESRGRLFDRVLALHRDLHDLDKPLVRADYEHALDVWQWVLRLAPAASRRLQIAALFHDIERLWSEPDVRIEQHASDYQAFKNAHAQDGAEVAARVLARAGMCAEESARVQKLIIDHEQPLEAQRQQDLATLADADALSFFALNSPGFADYYGVEHTRKKLAYTLGRMTDQALRHLGAIRLRLDVSRLLGELQRGGESFGLRGEPS